MQLKHIIYAIGITTHIVSIITLPITRPIEVIAGLSKHDPEDISARSSDDIVPVEECKRALGAAPVFDEALYRRCSGDGEVEEGNEADSDSGESDDGDSSGSENDDGNADNTQIASNSPRQDYILTQMELFPMPNLGLCTSLPDTPPTPNPAPPVNPKPAPVTPQPAPAPAPAPARKPVPVDADGPAREIPKRAIEVHGLEGILNRSPYLDDEDPTYDECKRSSVSTSSLEIQRRCGGGEGGDDGEGGGQGEDEGEGGGEGANGGKSDIDDAGNEDSSKDDFSDLDGAQLAALDLPDKWNDKWFCYAWIAVFGALPDVGCDMFRTSLPSPNSGPHAPASPGLPFSPPSPPTSPPSSTSLPHSVSGGHTGGRVPLMRRHGPEGVEGGENRCGVITVGSHDVIIKCE